VENLTHSLVGAAFAELALPPTASPAQRRLFFTASIIAANLPDADLLYARITPPPLGYLLHHRGHTHTLVGLAVQALVIGLVCLLPATKKLIAPLRTRFWTLIAASLLSHVVLDSLNSYGVHPFYPFNNRWYYGDAIYIVEPWLWVLLGVAVVVNTRNRVGRLGVVALMFVFSLVFVRMGFVSLGLLVAPVVVFAALAWIAMRASAHARTITALAAATLFVAMMFGLKHAVRTRALARAATDTGGDVLDVILSPRPANPFCWTVITVAKNEPVGTYAFRRGSLTPVPRWQSASHCDEWAEPDAQSLARLRDLARDDCWVRAWLRFGRAPYIEAGEIGDYRFGGSGNFSSMRLLPKDQAATCPSHLPSWEMPRRDLLRPSS
jgi:inner membrane protein